MMVLCLTLIPVDSWKCGVEWLHTPKTASTFCLSIQHGCDENRFLGAANDPVATVKVQHSSTFLVPNGTNTGCNHGHYPFTSATFPNIGSAVTLFRHPQSRFISSFEDCLHAEGMSPELKQSLEDKFLKPNNASMPKESCMTFQGETCVHDFLIWNSHPANHGCFTKMMNGYRCHEHIELTDDHLKLALERLEKFLFVGLVEEYSDSIKVFLKVMNQRAIEHNKEVVLAKESNLLGEDEKYWNKQQANLVTQPPHPMELGNYRPHPHDCDVAIEAAIKNGTIVYEDKYDLILYEAAVKKFHLLKERFGT